MSVDALIFWLFVVAWAIVLGALVFVALPRIVGEVLAIIRRLSRMLAQSPLPPLIAQAERDVARLEAVAAAAPALVLRADNALIRMRTTRLIPVSLLIVLGRLSTEITAFRDASR